MFKLTIKSLLDKKVRFALTTLAVVAGVAFVVGVFVMTDSLRSSFGQLAEDIAESSPLVVRTAQEVGEEIDRAPVPEALDAAILEVDGVADTIPGVSATNTIINKVDENGEAVAIIPRGPPTLGFSWAPDVFYLIEGDVPVESDEFVADATTVDLHDLQVGTTYTINGPIETGEFELVGVFNWGSPDENTSLGQTMAAFELEFAQEFLGLEGLYNSIGVIPEPGADVGAVQRDIQELVGRDYEVVTAETIEEETSSDIDEVIDIFNTVLLVFAFVIVFVSAFIINNTFQIVVAQRIRELGLLRAIGATGKQVRNSVLTEAVLVGAFSTLAGIGVGRFLAGGMRWMLNQGGFSLPAGPLEIAPRTIVWAVLVGMGVTLLSAVIPARRARTVSPIAAIQADHRLAGASLQRRLIIGGVLTGLGALLLLGGLFGGMGTTPTLVLVGFGAFLVFIGMNTLAPSFARPAANLIGRPIARFFGVPGQLAMGNAARSPRRTASTAAALMIGLSLVGMAGVVGESLTQSFLKTLDDAVESDYFIQSEAGGFDPTVGFAQEVAHEIEALPEFDTVVTYRFAIGSMRIDGVNRDLFATDFDLVESHMDADVVAGSLAEAGGDSTIALHVDSAEDLAVSVGDTLDATFPDNQTETLTVAAIYEDATIFGNWLIDNVTWEEHFTRQEIGFASATIAGFSDDLPEEEQQRLEEAAAEAIAPLEEMFPGVKMESRVEFRQGQQDQLNSFLIVITVMLGLSLVIALIGIANTLGLAVFERTREIGLVRAVGMTRRQLRRMIRWEAVIVAVFGALLGLALGVIFGVAISIAIPSSVISTVAVPWGTLVFYLIVAGFSGMIAALFPAIRASRLNVLEAIAYE